MSDLIPKRDRLSIMAEIERLRKLSKHPEMDPSIALACVERANRLDDDLRLTENGATDAAN